ncbi:pectate lyase superfamily protein-domain-containing protein, partial [Coniochaeta sp. 2T2.1]
MRVISLLLVASTVHAAYWMEQIAHRGKASFNPETSYTIFRNVKDFGAKGDGVTDDTAAINAAISTGNRCGGDSPCVGTTLTPAVVYFPGGTYKISSSIIDYYYTQIIGDPNNMPTIKASSDFSNRALCLIEADKYTSGGYLQFTSTNVFFRQVRNIIFDTRSVPGGACGIHWPSSQATSIQNCVFLLSNDPTDEHTAIFMESGSGGMLNDLVIYGGMYGVELGNQQYTMRNLTIIGAAIAVKQLWDWGWTYKSLNIIDCAIGIDMGTADVGGVTLIDSTFTNVTKAIITSRALTNKTGQGSFVMENVAFNNVPTVLEGPAGKVYLAGTKGAAVYEAGHASYLPNGPFPYSGSYPVLFPRPANLLLNNKYYERSKPQYENTTASNIYSARNFGAAGDGVTDDTNALRALFQVVAGRFNNGAVAFIDAGYYKVTDTVYIPPNIRIVGEAVSAVIMGAGPKFSDINIPRPVIQVGTSGQTGYVEISDIMLSTQGGTSGAVLIEYNLNTPTTSPPSGLWDVHVRVGGFAGSNLQLSDCPKTPSQPTAPDPDCIAAYMSFHITRSAGNLYVEGIWLWVADHDIEDPNNTQINVYAGRGMLIESQPGRIWLVGTAVEHHVLYQYQLVNTHDIFMGHIQTETPYYQPNPPAPYPFTTLNAALYDPDFAADCAGAVGPTGPWGSPTHEPPCLMAWGLRVLGSSNVVVYGAGLYSFFNNYSTNCSTRAAGENCQRRILASGYAGTTPPGLPFVVYNLDTIGAVSMFIKAGVDLVSWRDNFATFASTVAVL